MSDDDSDSGDLTELLRLAKGFHDIWAGDPELESMSAVVSQAKISDRQIHNVAQTLFDEFGHIILVAFTILMMERLKADEYAAAVYYQRILRAMAAIENTEPEPDDELH